MKNESAFDSLAQNQEEIDLLKMVYPDLVSISDDGRIMAKLSDDIDVTFTLPEGYPEKFVAILSSNLMINLCLDVRQSIKLRLQFT